MTTRKSTILTANVHYTSLVAKLQWYIRDGTIIFNGKISSIFREKNQTRQVSAGLECGITLKDFVDFQKNDVIEVYNSIITERTI